MVKGKVENENVEKYTFKKHLKKAVLGSGSNGHIDSAKDVPSNNTRQRNAAAATAVTKKGESNTASSLSSTLLPSTLKHPNNALNTSFSSTSSSRPGTTLGAIKDAIQEEDFDFRKVLLLVVDLVQDHETALRKIRHLEAHLDALEEEKKREENRKKKEECIQKKNHLLGPRARDFVPTPAVLTRAGGGEGQGRTKGI